MRDLLSILLMIGLSDLFLDKQEWLLSFSTLGKPERLWDKFSVRQLRKSE